MSVVTVAPKAALLAGLGVMSYQFLKQTVNVKKKIEHMELPSFPKLPNLNVFSTEEEKPPVPSEMKFNSQYSSELSLLSTEYKLAKCGHCDEIMEDPIEVNGVIYERGHIQEYAKNNRNRCPKKD